MGVTIYFPGQGTLAEEKYLEGKVQGEAEGKVEGKAEGKAESLLLFLQVRGIPVPDSTRDRINACTDLETLDLWLVRAVTVADACSFRKRADVGAQDR